MTISKSVVTKPAFTLGQKSVLAAAVALLSGAALAEQAGRVSFVAGSVSVTSPDGQARTLKRGDLINGGDRINTGSGRLQLRFTDGGFVSLQPNTVFAVDQYLYANKAPEETSLFFNLVRGGMRTITGAIGKVSKQNYKVRTPVATIGIRGTEYVATVDDDGLVVSVGSGFVNVMNPQGDLTGGVGQSIAVPPGGVPAFTDTRARARARGANDPEGELAESNSEDDSADAPVVLGNIVSTDGIPRGIDLPEFSLPTGTGYTLVMVGGGLENSLASNLDASFNQTNGALLAATMTGQYPMPVLLSDSFKVQGVVTNGSLSWGEFTDGAGTIGTPVTLTATDFRPYVIGIPTAVPKLLGAGTASYQWVGGTPVRSNNGAVGTMDHFDIDINFDFSTVSVDMAVVMGGNTYQVNTLSAAPVNVSGMGSSSSFNLSSNVLQVTSSACASAGFCTAKVDAFFAGPSSSQLGVGFTVNTSSDGSISGTGGLGLSGSAPTSTTAPDGKGYTMVFAGTISSVLGGYADPMYDTSLTNTFDANGGLLTATTSGVTSFDRGTATALNVARNGNLSWGRWANGSVTELGSPSVLGSTGQGLHYITGPMTPSNAFYGGGLQGSAHYTYAGGTQATGSDGRTGTLSGTVDVVFGSFASMSMALGLAMDTGTSYAINGTGLSVGPNFVDTTGAGNLTCVPTCAATVSGFFAGAQAQQIGLSYQVSDLNPVSLATINGVAGFNRGAITPLPQPPSGP